MTSTWLIPAGRKTSCAVGWNARSVRVYATNDDSKEKCNVGQLWEEKSSGKAIFLMTVLDKGKPGLFEQIAAKIG